MGIRRIQERPERMHSQEIRVNTHNMYQALSSLETGREENDEIETPSYVVHKSDTGKWAKEEAVVDSGVVECLTSRKRMPQLRVEERSEYRRGESCTCAGGNDITKDGKVTVKWRTDLGAAKQGVFKARRMSRTLISVDRHQERGRDGILTKNHVST